ncbi:MAG: hypothetical protein WAV11_01960 [Minisyncoccia bacterium]
MMDSIINLIKSPVIPQVAAFLTIIAIPYALFKLIFYKAKFKIFFSPKETYYEVKLLDHPSRPQSYWIHLMAKNRGFEISKNTEAYLTEIWIKNEKGLNYSRIDEFRAPVKLKWAHEAQIAPVDVLPKHKRRLDVCYICEGEQILRIMAQAFPSGSIKNELLPGDYIFIIHVVSDNGLRPARFLLNISWDGKWRTLKGGNYVKPFRLTAEPVKSFCIY